MLRTTLAASLLVVLVSVPAGAQDIVQNGGFEAPAIAGSFEVHASIPGWTDTVGHGIEIHRGCCGAPYAGDQYVELDSFAPITLSQTLNTDPSCAYQLSFAFSPRPGTPAADNVLRVHFAGSVITTVSADGSGLGDTSWTTYSFPVTPSGGATSILLLEDVSAATTLGTFVDDVRVEQTCPVPVLPNAAPFVLAALLAASAAWLGSSIRAAG